MKTLLSTFLCLIVCLLTTAGFAQTYTPFPTENAVWYDQILVTGLYSNPYYTNVYGFQGDTLIDGMTYTKVYGVQDSVFNLSHETTFYKGAMREENKQIAFIESGTTAAEEYILYDFNVQIGDTLSINYHLATTTLVVANIVEAELLSGEIRTKYELHLVTDLEGMIDATPAYDIWEGMGSTRGLFYDSYWATAQDEFPNDSITQHLSCHHLNGEMLYNNTGNNDCYFKSIETAITEINTENSFSIYPNPATITLTIELENTNLEVNKVLIYNALGQKVLERKWMNDNQLAINISTLPIGFYTLTLIDKAKNSRTKQLVIQR